MPQPSFDHEGEDKPDRSDTTASDKKRFERTGPDVGYVRDLPIHTGVPRLPLSEPNDEHRKQHSFPHESCEDGNPYVTPVGVEAAHGR